MFTTCFPGPDGTIRAVEPLTRTHPGGSFPRAGGPIDNLPPFLCSEAALRMEGRKDSRVAFLADNPQPLELLGRALSEVLAA
ncbi:unnamed protein product [Calypogeia fissa]